MPLNWAEGVQNPRRLDLALPCAVACIALTQLCRVDADMVSYVLICAYMYFKLTCVECEFHWVAPRWAWPPSGPQPSPPPTSSPLEVSRDKCYMLLQSYGTDLRSVDERHALVLAWLPWQLQPTSQGHDQVYHQYGAWTQTWSHMCLYVYICIMNLLL